MGKGGARPPLCLYMSAVFEFGGGHAGTALEDPGKILRAFKAQSGGDLRDIQWGFPEQGLGLFNFSVGGVDQRGNPQLGLEKLV